MGKKKTTTQTTNQYEYKPRPVTPEIETAREQIKNVDFTSPVVHAFGQAENDIENAMYDDHLPDGVKEKIKLGQLFNLRMNKGAALSDARSREEQYKTQGNLSLAGLTQAPLIQTGGTTTTVQPFNWGSLVSGGLGAAATLGTAATSGGGSLAASAL